MARKKDGKSTVSDQRDEFLVLVRSALEIMAVSHIASLGGNREATAWVLQAHLLDLWNVMQIANGKLRKGDRSFDAASDVIDNLFDGRYGREGERDNVWLSSFRKGRPPSPNRAAWAGLKTRSEWKALLDGQKTEVLVGGQWVPDEPEKTPAEPAPKPSGMEAYNAARKGASEARRRKILEKAEVQIMLIALRRAGSFRMREVIRLLSPIERTAAVRIMKWLKDQGWVATTGEGTGTRWVATQKLLDHSFER